MNRIAAKITGTEGDPCCCEEAVCCLYPASLLGDGYPATDLPDSVIFGTGDPSGICYRDGDSYYSDDSFPSPYFFRVEWSVDGWILTLGLVGYGDMNTRISPCLIFENTIPPPDPEETGYFVEDQFPGSLFMSSVWDTATLTRDSLCVWSGVSDTLAEPVVLYYMGHDDGGLSGLQPYKWNLSAGPNAGTKSANQSSPAGTYDVGGDTATLS